MTTHCGDPRCTSCAWQRRPAPNDVIGWALVWALVIVVLAAVAVAVSS